MPNVRWWRTPWKACLWWWSGSAQQDWSRKAAPYYQSAQKIQKNGQTIAVDVKERSLRQNHIFWTKKTSLPLKLKRTGATAGTHTDLPAWDVDKNVQVSPFWKMLANLSPPLLGGWKKSVPHFQLWMVNSLCQLLPGAAPTLCVVPALCYISWLKISLSTGWCTHHACCHFSFEFLEVNMAAYWSWLLYLTDLNL